MLIPIVIVASSVLASIWFDEWLILGASISHLTLGWVTAMAVCDAKREPPSYMVALLWPLVVVYLLCKASLSK